MTKGALTTTTCLAACALSVSLSAASVDPPIASEPSRANISQQDRAMLEDLERRSVRYFWTEADPATGLVLDRASADGGRAKGPSRDIASLAATGFGLTAICIGAEHGWIPRDQVQIRVRTTLEFFASKAYQEHGWFFHWMDVSTGARKWDSEMSSIDTAFLLAGVLTAAQYFSNDPEITKLATQIYSRVDFAWMLDGDSLLLSHGMVRGKGFLKYKWEAYSELPLLYLLAIGSSTHPISPNPGTPGSARCTTMGRIISLAADRCSRTSIPKPGWISGIAATAASSIFSRIPPPPRAPIASIA